MKKLIVKCTAMVVIAMGVSHYGMYLTTGKAPSMSAYLPDLSFSAPDLSFNAPTLDDLKPNTTEDTVYKWVDSQGVTQYSSEPPPEVIQAQVLELDQNTNVIKGLDMSPPEEEKPQQQTAVAPPQGPAYSPGNIKKLMDDAKNVQNLLDERFKNQQEALDNL